MEKSTTEKRMVAGNSALHKYSTFCNAAYGTDYRIELLPYQQRGIIVRELWSTRDHVLRIIPGFDEETGEIYRQNCKVSEFADDADYRDYISNTLYECNVMSKLGDNSLLIADYKPGSKEAETYGSDTVFSCFSRTIYNTVKAERDRKRVFCPGIEDWKIWTALQGSLPLPRRAILMQVLSTKVNGRFNNCALADKEGDSHTDLVDANGAPLPLLMVTAIVQKESVKNLLQALVEPRDPGMPLDAITNNKYGGLAEADGNMLYLNHVQTTEGKNYLKPSVQPAGQGWTPELFPLTPDQIRALWVPWNKLLHFLTPSEQFEILAATFGADTVNYVCGLDPRLRDLVIPSEIWRAGFGRYAGFVDTEKSAMRSAKQQGSTRVSAPSAAPKPMSNLLPSQPKIVAPAAAKKVAPVAATQVAHSLGVPAVAAPAQAKPAMDSALQFELNRMRNAGVGTNTIVDDELPQDEASAIMEELLNAPEVEELENEEEDGIRM